MVGQASLDHIEAEVVAGLHMWLTTAEGAVSHLHHGLSARLGGFQLKHTEMVLVSLLLYFYLLYFSICKYSRYMYVENLDQFAL